MMNIKIEKRFLFEDNDKDIEIKVTEKQEKETFRYIWKKRKPLRIEFFFNANIYMRSLHKIYAKSCKSHAK